MALDLGTNFRLQSEEFNFERDSFATLAEMKAFPLSSVPDGFTAFCEQDFNHYIMCKGCNPSDETGYWRNISTVTDFFDNPVDEFNYSRPVAYGPWREDRMAIVGALTNKVDKVTGKGLSTNDYTTAEKQKLASLSNYDDNSVVKSIKINGETKTPTSGLVDLGNVGGGGVSVEIAQTTGQSTTAVMSQKAVTDAIGSGGASKVRLGDLIDVSIGDSGEGDVLTKSGGIWIGTKKNEQSNYELKEGIHHSIFNYKLNADGVATSEVFYRTKSYVGFDSTAKSITIKSTTSNANIYRRIGFYTLKEELISISDINNTDNEETLEIPDSCRIIKLSYHRDNTQVVFFNVKKPSYIPSSNCDIINIPYNITRSFDFEEYDRIGFTINARGVSFDSNIGGVTISASKTSVSINGTSTTLPTSTTMAYSIYINRHYGIITLITSSGDMLHSEKINITDSLFNITINSGIINYISINKGCPTLYSDNSKDSLSRGFYVTSNPSRVFFQKWTSGTNTTNTVYGIDTYFANNLPSVQIPFTLTLRYGGLAQTQLEFEYSSGTITGVRYTASGGSLLYKFIDTATGEVKAYDELVPENRYILFGQHSGAKGATTGGSIAIFIDGSNITGEVSNFISVNVAYDFLISKKNVSNNLIYDVGTRSNDTYAIESNVISDIKTNNNTSTDADFVGQQLIINQDIYTCVGLPRVWKKITP